MVFLVPESPVNSIENLRSKFKADIHMHNTQNRNDLEMHGSLFQEPSTSFSSVNSHGRKSLSTVIFYSILGFTYYCEAIVLVV